MGKDASGMSWEQTCLDVILLQMNSDDRVGEIDSGLQGLKS